MAGGAKAKIAAGNPAADNSDASLSVKQTGDPSDPANTLAGVQAQNALFEKDYGTLPTLQNMTALAIAQGNRDESSGLGGFLDKYLPTALVGGLTAGLGSGLVAAGADALGSTGGIAAGAGLGAATGAGTATLEGGNIGKGALLGGITGALGTAASGLASNANGALENAGLNPTVSNAITTGAEKAGTGALTGAIGGTGAANGALLGGLSGAVQGGITGAINNNGTATAPKVDPITGVLVGAGSGILASDLVGKYATPTAPTPAAPAPVASTAVQAKPAAPAKSTTQPVVAPVTPAKTAAPPAATPAPATTPTNIGSYSGFNSTGLGYQPMQQSNYANTTNWNNYGQGPEQSFFQPVPGTT